MMNRIQESFTKLLHGESSSAMNRVRWFLVLATWLGYILAFPMLYQRMGAIALSFSGFPVLFTAWHSGVPGGLSSAVIVTGINWLLMYLNGNHDWFDIIQSSYFGFFLLLLGGIVIGRVNDLRRKLKKELEEKERTSNKYRSIVQSSIDGIVLVDEEGKIIEWNHGQEEITGYRQKDVCGKYIWEIYFSLQPDTQKVPSEKDKFRSQVLEALQTGDGYWLNQLTEREIQQKDGTRFHIQIRKYPIKTNSGYMVGIFSRDVTERKKTEELLLESEERFRSTISQSADGILVADKDLKIIEWSSSQTEIFGYSREEMLDKPIWQFQYDIVPEEHRPPGFLDHLKKRPGQIIDDGTFVEEEISRDIEIQTKEGARKIVQISSFPIITSSGNLYGAIIRDISEQKKFEQHLQHSSTHDSLTDLPNRTLLNDRLTHSLSKSERNNEKLAVLYIDLDNFKAVNDTYGHAAGDILLKQFTKRIQDQTRKCDTVARMSGDEFIMVLEAISDPEHTRTVAEKIIRMSEEPFQMDDEIIESTLSIGISIFPNDGTDPEILLQRADAAMYQAKQKGKNNLQFYGSD